MMAMDFLYMRAAGASIEASGQCGPNKAGSERRDSVLLPLAGNIAAITRA
jgi:hypothetical protein